MPAVLGVIAAFMAGLALGAWRISASRLRRPGRAYALLEFGIGFWALLTTRLIPEVNELAPHWIGLSAGRHWIISFVAPLVVLLPATAAMGATLPAVERLMTPLHARGHSIGALYAANTAGAVFGVLAGTFLVLPRWGLRSTVLSFAIVNIVCGLLAWCIAGRAESLKSKDEEPSVGRRLWMTLFLTGLFGIGYEIVGVRILAQVLENTVYTYAAVLAIFLLGTAAGGAIYHVYAPRLALRHLLTLTSACALGGVVIAAGAERLYELCRDFLGDTPIGVVSAEMFVAASVFLLPAASMGATFSSLAHQSGNVGRALAFNTLGASVAPFLASVVAVPWFGAKWTIVGLSLGYLTLLPTFRRGISLLPVAVLLAFCVSANLRFLDVPPQGRLVEFREGTMASVAVVEDAARRRVLRVDNRFQMGGTGVAEAEYRHAHIPLLLHPKPERALFLGLGTGITFSAASLHSSLTRAEGVELLPEVIAVMNAFAPFNYQADARLHKYIADARRFVIATTNRYDVVVGDLFHPARDGAGSLYTVEHFGNIRRKLAPGGLFCQWLPLHQLDEQTLRVIVRTFLEVFPESDAWLLRFNVDAPVVGLIGYMDRVRYTADWLERRSEQPALRERLQKLALNDSLRLFGNYLAGPDELRMYSAEARLNTDDNAVVLFSAPRFSYLRNVTSYGRLMPFIEFRVATMPAPIDDLEPFVGARNVFLKGLIAESEGKLEEAYDAYLRSARMCEEFTAGYARVLAAAAAEARSNRNRSRALLEKLIEAQPARPAARELLNRLDRESGL